MEYVGKTNLPSRAVCRTQGPRTCEAWSGGWPARGSWKLPDIQYCLNIENLGIAWPNIQYCLKEMLDIENRLASKTVPRNVKDFPTLWNKIMLMFVLAIMIIGVVFTRAKQWSMILVIRTFAKWWSNCSRLGLNDDHNVQDSGNWWSCCWRLWLSDDHDWGYMMIMMFKTLTKWWSWCSPTRLTRAQQPGWSVFATLFLIIAEINSNSASCTVQQTNRRERNDVDTVVQPAWL